MTSNLTRAPRGETLPTITRPRVHRASGFPRPPQASVAHTIETVPDPILDPLNPEQLAAVTHGDGPLLILAGAGSGKTRVLTHRVAFLIREGISPRSILAVTFTNKAAREMKERLERLLAGTQLQDLTVGTFHAFCARLLPRGPLAARRAS